MKNIISVDVEDYFHPSEVNRYVTTADWEGFAPRVEDSTGRVLDLFARHGVKGTFFILGWCAERHPAMVRRIADAGHEIACHSYWHRLVYELSPAEFREDTERACRVIEDACGVRPRMYRAPSYSVTRESMWALDVLADLGFTADSSIYPIEHDRYGIPGFSRTPVVMETESGPMLEVPIATVRLNGGKITPIGGGGYVRLLPYRYTAAGLRRLNRNEGEPGCMYFHPWEVDPEQPKLAKGILSRWRTYAGLRGMEGKIGRLFDEFAFGTVSEVCAQMMPAAPEPVAS